MARPQLGERQVATDIDTEFEADAGRFEQLPAPQHDVFFQLEARNAVDQQATHAVVAIIHDHLIAERAKLLGSCQTARAGTNDANRLLALACRRTRRDPALVERMVGHETLHSANGDAVKALFDDAIAFAEPILRADTPADFRKIVGRRADLVGFFKPALGGQLQPIGNVVVERAVH